MLDIIETSLGVEDWHVASVEGDVVELPLLLPGWQMSKLESVAHQRGMTAAEMVRNLLGNFLSVSSASSRVSSS